MKPKTQKILEFIVEYYLIHGHSPSIREISEEIDLATSACYRHVATLVSDGYLLNMPHQKRTIVPTKLAYRLLHKKAPERNLSSLNYQAILDELLRTQEELATFQKLYEAQLEASAFDQHCLKQENERLRALLPSPP